MRVCQFRHIRNEVDFLIVGEQGRCCQCDRSPLTWSILEAEAEVNLQTPIGRLAATALTASSKREGLTKTGR